MLKLSHVKKTFNKGTVTEKRALTGVDLTLNDGDFVTVIGGNGAGKSTLLNMIAGVYPLDSGVIELDGTDISRLSESQRAKYLGRVFQDPMRGTAADMQIAENLALAARRAADAAAHAEPVTRTQLVADAAKPVMTGMAAAEMTEAEKLAEIKGVSPQRLADQTFENACAVYRIPASDLALQG